MQRQDSGTALVVMVVVMLPLAVVVAALSTLLSGRDARLRGEMHAGRALDAAEAGIAHAIHLANRDELVAGTPVAGDLGGGQWYEFASTRLDTDAEDNDGDGAIDEPDEAVFLVTSTGRAARAVRVIAVRLRRPAEPTWPDAAILLHGPTRIELRGSTVVSGCDEDVDDPGLYRPAFGCVTAELVDHARGEILGHEELRTDGCGPAPHVEAALPIDLPTWVERSRERAHYHPARDHYAGARWGSPEPGRSRITVRDGNLTLTGRSEGAGILIVTGDLTLSGGFRYEGMVIVLGSLRMTGGAAIHGSLVLGPASGRISSTGDAEVRYSQQALRNVQRLTGNHDLEAWQEASNNGR